MEIDRGREQDKDLIAEGLRLARIFLKIENPADRLKVIELAEAAVSRQQSRSARDRLS